MWSRLQKPLVLFVFRPIWHAACNCVLSLSSLKEEFMSINRKSLMDFIICRMYLRKFFIDIVFKENIFTRGTSISYTKIFFILYNLCKYIYVLFYSNSSIQKPSSSWYLVNLYPNHEHFSLLSCVTKKGIFLVICRKG